MSAEKRDPLFVVRSVNPANQHLAQSSDDGCGSCLHQLLMERRSKLIETVWTMVCMIGLVIQLVMVSQQYLDYPTTSRVGIDYEFRFEPPAVSYCCFLPRLIDVSKAQMEGSCLKYNETSGPEVKKCYFEVFRKNNTNFDVMFNRYTYDIRPHEGKKEVESYYFYRSFQKCVRIRSKPMIEFRKFDQKEVLRFQVQNVEKITAYFFIFIHDRDTFPREIPSIFDYNYKQIITYWQYRSVHLSTLKEPCIDYRKTRWDSQEHCEEECSNVHLLKTCYEMPTNDSWDFKSKCLKLFSNGQVDLLNFDFEKHYRMIMSDPPRCDRDGKCVNSCIQRFYKPIVTLYSGPEMFNEVRHVNPTTLVEFALKIELLEYIIYVASLMGLWFGFSIIDFFEKIASKSIVYFKNRTQNKNITLHNNVAVQMVTLQHKD